MIADRTGYSIWWFGRHATQAGVISDLFGRHLRTYDIWELNEPSWGLWTVSGTLVHRERSLLRGLRTGLDFHARLRY